MRILHISDLHYANKTLDEVDKCVAAAINAGMLRGAELAVVSGDSSDHALDAHSPAFAALARQIRRLADQCPVLMLQGTFSHEPPGTLDVFRLLGGRYPVHVADRISQVAWRACGRWEVSDGWALETMPDDALALFTCLPTVNKACVAAAVGAVGAGEAVGAQLSALLGAYAPYNARARAAGIPTIGVAHGTVNGCVTEHGVPMAGMDHEFSVGSLFSAQASAFMLGHIHKRQSWEMAGRVVAYAGSIARLHYGEEDEKGGLLWEVTAGDATYEVITTPARRMVHLEFAGKPDLAVIRGAAAEVQGAFVRVRWQVPEEDKSVVDRHAIIEALQGAAEVRLEGRIIPVQRARAAGISRASTLADKLRQWAALTGVQAAPLTERLEALTHQDPEQIAAIIIGGQPVL
jgi:exonuclease SbcD